MIENKWSVFLRRCHAAATTDLAKRAINVCDAWVSWADAFGISPPAELALKLQTADPVHGAGIARQITLKLAGACPVQMPMPLPVELAVLLDGAEDAVASSSAGPEANGPRPC
jgi:hypothetical protein